ncbi:hypothetical protein MHU86_3085 [Fragilaria crotonensis]|nr:hypothetical protein MHU86_3085 [Fragilaria crotonensis]
MRCRQVNPIHASVADCASEDPKSSPVPSPNQCVHHWFQTWLDPKAAPIGSSDLTAQPQPSKALVEHHNTERLLCEIKIVGQEILIGGHQDVIRRLGETELGRDAKVFGSKLATV